MPVPVSPRPALVARLEVVALVLAALVVALRAVEAAPRLIRSLMELIPWS